MKNKIEKVLKNGEIEILKRLNDEVYTVEFFEIYFSPEYTIKNQEQHAQAAGFFRAVQKAAEADLHIFPKAYVRMLSSVESAVDKFSELSGSFKMSMNNAEDLFILAQEDNNNG